MSNVVNTTSMKKKAGSDFAINVFIICDQDLNIAANAL